LIHYLFINTLIFDISAALGKLLQFIRKSYSLVKQNFKDIDKKFILIIIKKEKRKK